MSRCVSHRLPRSQRQYYTVLRHLTWLPRHPAAHTEAADDVATEDSGYFTEARSRHRQGWPQGGGRYGRLGGRWRRCLRLAVHKHSVAAGKGESPPGRHTTHRGETWRPTAAPVRCSGACPCRPTSQDVRTHTAAAPSPHDHAGRSEKAT